MTRSEVERLIGQRVMVYAPSYGSTPASELHGHVVTLVRISPTQPEIVRTSEGPLQWTRSLIELTPLSKESSCPS